MSVAEDRFRRMERLVAELADELLQLRNDLNLDEPDEDRRARRMWKVLEEVAAQGARVAPHELLDIGERHGYRRRGMAGFYQDLFTLDGQSARLTASGRSRLEALRKQFTPADALGEST